MVYAIKQVRSLQSAPAFCCEGQGAAIMNAYDTPGMIEFRTPSSGTYFARLTRSLGGAFGCDAKYYICLPCEN